MAHDTRIRTWQRVSRDMVVVYYATFGMLHILLPGAFAPLLHVDIPLPHEASSVIGVFELVAAIELGFGMWKRMAGLALAFYAALAVPSWVNPTGFPDHSWHARITYAYEWLQVDLRFLLIWIAMFASAIISFPFRPAR